MPTQRAKKKVLLGGYVDRELHREICELARLEGMDSDRFGFVRKLILEAVGPGDTKTAATKRPKSRV